MSSLISIYIGGGLTLVIAIYHTQLFKKINWQDEFKKIEPGNARILYTINLALTIIFLIIGFISICYAKELSGGSGFAFGFSISYSCFWIWRLVWQMTYLKKENDQISTRLDISKILVPLVISFCYIFPSITNIFCE